MSKHNVNGWVVLDKPLGLSSTQAVSRIKRIFAVKKAGHVGTLDPLASGVLPIALGKATALIPYYQDDIKEYEFTVQWGIQTTTDDLEGEVLQSSEQKPSASDVSNILPQFLGKIAQTPPIFSAIKINGEVSYTAARKGKALDLPQRQVTIHQLTLIEHNPQLNQTSFGVQCGKGTYIRSLARDMGLILGCYGTVSYLRRTKSGFFDLAYSFSLDKIKEMPHNVAVSSVVLPLGVVLDDIPAIPINEGEKQRLVKGLPIALPDQITESMVFSLWLSHELVAIGQIKDNEIWPKRVLSE